MNELIVASGVPRKDIAEATGINLRNIQYYISKERQPALAIAVKFAEYFRVSLDYLVGRTDDPTPPVLAKNWPESIGTPKKD